MGNKVGGLGRERLKYARLFKTVLAGQAKADYRKGGLRIELPRGAQPQGRRIEVRSD